MADVHSKAVRSYNMSKIKGKNTKPEVLVRKFLFSRGLRYKLHDKSLPGRPDIVMPKYKTVIFVNGCFWHGHNGCKYFVYPKTKAQWWSVKINGNIKRDSLAYASLKDQGWSVIVIWECELKSSKRDETLENVFKNLVS